MKRFAVFVLIMGGCAVGPNYHHPQTALPASWSETSTNASAQLLAWWKTFNDAELNSLIQRAVAANHDLRIATGRVRETRALRSGAAWDFAPVVDGQASFTDQRISRNAQLFPTTNFPLRIDSDLYDARFDARWEIDVFGGKRRALEAANAQLAATEDDRRDVLVTLAAEVARNYVELRGLQRRLAIAQENIQAQRSALDLTTARYTNGVSSRLDVTQAAALLSRTQSQVPALNASAKQAMHRLAVLIGQPPVALTAELSPEAPIPPTPPAVPVGLPSDLLRRRADVRRAERQLAAVTARIGVETAELFPKFSLVGAGGFQSLSASDWFSGGSRFWTAGPTVTWRLLDYGRIRSQIKAAGARAEEFLANYEKTVLISLEDVENALVAYSSEQTRRESLNATVAANRQSLELAQERYTKGVADFLNVLDAQRSLYQAEDDLVQSDKTVSQNLIALYKALGGGWESFHDAQARAD